MRALPFVALLLAGTSLLPAQTVVRPPAPLDSARVVVRDALVLFSDTLGTIGAAAARLQRDNSEASGPVLLSRARMMQEACAHSIRMVPATRDAVLATKNSQAKRLKHQKDLVVALDRLKVALGRCESEFAGMSRPGQSETVRGYGNDRADRVRGALRSYEQTLHDFFGVMGIRVVPAGAAGPPASG